VSSRSSCRVSQEGHEYDIDHYNALFYITTNRKAKNFGVVTAPVAQPCAGTAAPPRTRSAVAVHERIEELAI
jgi:protease II